MRSGYFTKNLAGVQPVQRRNRAIALALLAGTFAVSGNAWANCDVVVTDGLVACYPFDGNANDESGNGNNGTPHSGISYTTGVIDQAAKLDGSPNGYIRVGNPTQKFDKQYTITAWVSTVGSGMPIFSKYSWNGNSGRGFNVASTTPDGNGYAHNGSTLFSVSMFDEPWIPSKYPSYTLPVNQFKYVTAVYDTGNMKLYVDGQVVAEKNIQHLATLDNSYDILIGSYFENNGTLIVASSQQRSFDGLIDDLRIYNRALSEAEIKKLYESSPTKCEDPAKRARYSYKTGRVDIPFTDVPLLEETSPNATGEQAVFKGLRLRLNADQDFEIVDPSAKLDDSGEPAGDPCHAVYIYENRTLKIPAVEVPTVLATFPTIKEGKPISVYEVLFQHIQTTPIDLGFLHLQEATLLEVIE